MDNIDPKSANGLPMTRSGRKRKATAKLAETNGLLPKKVLPLMKAKLERGVQLKRSNCTNKPVVVSKFNQNRHEAGRTGHNASVTTNQDDPAFAAANTPTEKACQQAASAGREDHQLSPEKNSGSFEKNSGKVVLQKGGKSMGSKVNSQKNLGIKTLQARKSASVSRRAKKRLGERTDDFVSHSYGKGTKDQAKHRASKFSVANEVAASSLNTSYEVGMGRVCLERNVLSGTSQGTQNIINRQSSNQEEVASNRSDPEIFSDLAKGASSELGNGLSPLATMSAAIEAAKLAQSRSCTARPGIGPQPKSSIAPHHDLPGSRGNMPMHLNHSDFRGALEINETSVAATPTPPTKNVTFAVTETAGGSRKKLSTPAKRSLTRGSQGDSLNEKKKRYHTLLL